MSCPEPELRMLKSDDTLIKNPFACQIKGVENKYWLKPIGKSNVGNTDFVDSYEDVNDNIQIVNEKDPKLNYLIGNNPIKNPFVETSCIDKYDYEIPASVLNEKSKYKNHKDGLPISFIQIDNIKDGIAWYKEKYPKIPDDLLPIIARYHWGEPMTKKGLKNEKKKLKKKKVKELNKYSIKKGNYKITWD
tara:strand:- start:174 stop:743 length:570 start_codon:yes stop_codon:yes gene_type:complete